MFRNTLTANDEYPFRDLENLCSPTQFQVSLKPKTFSDFFNPFLESTSNFEHFGKNDDNQCCFITEITVCERLGLTAL